MSIKCVINDKTYIFTKQTPQEIDGDTFSLLDSIDDSAHKFYKNDIVVSISTYSDCYPTFRDIGGYDNFLDRKEKEIIENNKSFESVIQNLRKIHNGLSHIKNAEDLLLNNVKNIVISRKTLLPIISTTLKLFSICKDIPEYITKDDINFIFSNSDNKSKITNIIKVISTSVLLDSKNKLVDNLNKEKENNKSDIDLCEEIDVILTIVEESVNVDTFKNSETIDDLINYWPSILLPVPFK